MKQQVSHYRFAVKYGLMVAAIPIFYYSFLVIFGLLNEYYGDDIGGGMRIPSYLFIMPVFITIAIYRFRKMNDGILKLKSAFLIGLSIAIITSVLMILYHMLFNNVLAPSFHERYFEQFGDEVYKELVACCDYTIEQFESQQNPVQGFLL